MRSRENQLETFQDFHGGRPLFCRLPQPEFSTGFLWPQNPRCYWLGSIFALNKPDTTDSNQVFDSKDFSKEK
jgi:hypothetical protein